jgi:hypothetical protein
MARKLRKGEKKKKKRGRKKKRCVIISLIYPTALPKGIYPVAGLAVRMGGYWSMNT